MKPADHVVHHCQFNGSRQHNACISFLASWLQMPPGQQGGKSIPKLFGKCWTLTRLSGLLNILSAFFTGGLRASELI